LGYHPVAVVILLVHRYEKKGRQQNQMVRT